MNRADLLNMGADLRVVFGGYVAITAGGGGDCADGSGGSHGRHRVASAAQR